MEILNPLREKKDRSHEISIYLEAKDVLAPLQMYIFSPSSNFLCILRFFFYDLL